MKYRPLGKSGIEASVVGLGAWAIGGWMWGGTKKNDPHGAIRAAIDHGINLIDTAQTHWQDSTTKTEDTMAELMKLKQEGKIRAIGCSNATLEQMRRYQASGQLD